MSYTQVIYFILILAICNDALGKTSDDVQFPADSKNHERSRRQLSFGFGIPNVGRYEEEIKDPTGILNPLLKELDPLLPKAPPEDPANKPLAEHSFDGNIFKKKLTVYDPLNLGAGKLAKNKDGTEAEEDNLVERPCYCAAGGPGVQAATHQGLKLKKIDNIRALAVDKNGAASKDPPQQYDITGECTCWFLAPDGHAYNGNENTGVGILSRTGK